MVKNRKKRLVNIRLAFNTIFLATLAFCIFRYYPSIRKEFVQQTVKQEFILKSINITGVENIKEDLLRKGLPVNTGMPMADVNVRNIDAYVSQNSWVDKLVVYVVYPDVINIEITEKIPEVITKQEGEFIISDKNGDFLTKEMLEKYSSLPMVIAEKEKISDIVDYMKTQPYLYDSWDRAEFVGNRRWNIYIKDGIKVMLPEENVEIALERLNELRLKGEIFSYGISSIDLRFEDRAIVK